MTEKENEEVGFTKNNKRHSSCFVKRLCHAREKKTRPSGKSGGLELTKDSLGCAAREGEVNEPEDWGGVLILCARMSSPHPSPCCICLKLYL